MTESAEASLEQKIKDAAEAPPEPGIAELLSLINSPEEEPQQQQPPPEAPNTQADPAVDYKEEVRRIAEETAREAGKKILQESAKAAKSISEIHTPEMMAKRAAISKFMSGKETEQDVRIAARLGAVDQIDYLFSKAQQTPEYLEAVQRLKESEQAAAGLNHSGVQAPEKDIKQMTDRELAEAAGFGGGHWIGKFGKREG